MNALFDRIILLLEKIFATVEPDRASFPPENSTIVPSEIKNYDLILPKIIKLNISWLKKSFLTKSRKPIGLIVHYTVSGKTEEAAKSVAGYFSNTPKTLGYQIACPIMSQSGTIYVSKDWDILKDCNNNAGVSSWKGMTGLSQKFLGIEICSWGLLDSVTTKKVPETEKRVTTKRDNIKAGVYEIYTPEQEKALISLCFYLKKTCPDFTFDNVVGHDEIAPTRKSDPGGSLSMTMPAFRRYLYENYPG